MLEYELATCICAPVILSFYLSVKLNILPNLPEKGKVSYEEFEGVLKKEILAKTDQEFDLLEAFRFVDTARAQH